jgi:hypothetical protein
MFASDVDANNFFAIWFREEGDNGRLEILNYSTTYDMRIETTQVFRDVSAWGHLVVAIDTTQATSTNRVKIYWNGTQITALSTTTYPSQNFETDVNNTNSHKIGVQGSSYGRHNGYLTEINFIDGQALTPSDFGETDSATGVWKPKAYSGTYGTNGFFLKFADNSNTTAATLGKDSSSNSNNWTPNNFSVTAGAGNDSLVDSPTAYGTDTGVGGEVRGNYCTWNPLAKGSNTTLSNGNLDVLGSTNSTGNNNFSTFIPSSEKWYFEVSPANTYSYSYVGVSLDGNLSTSSNFVGATASSVGIELGTGAVWRNNSNQGTGGTGVSAGETLMVAFEPSSGKVWAGRNGTWYNSGNPAAGTGQVATIPTVGAIGPAVSPYSSSGTLSFNFGQRAFAYTAPSGFKALCTTNLPTPTIGATSTTQAGKYFNAILYTGNGNASRSITGVGFQPDFVWAKARSAAYYHGLFDAVRSGYALYSNATDAEDTTEQLTFGSDGFTTPNKSGDFINTNSATYVAWNWNAGGSNATNTSGTITSTVRANTTSGFSIVTYTGTGANATVGHGLGVAPSIVIVKKRSASENWVVYHTSVGATKYLVLNLTDAETTSATRWNNTAPTSTVFSIGTSGNVNDNTGTYVAYCFAPVAGYSAFGSYTGNGSTDGPMIFTGFRPRYVMVKRTDASGNEWEIRDTARDSYNSGTSARLWASSSASELNDFPADILSNGFKPRSTGTNSNGSGATYIYMAFAETPFKYSLGR